MDMKHLRQYVGDSTQLYSVKEYQQIGGKADGTKAIDIKNGLGLDLTISASRGADITYLNYKGDNYSFISPAGVVAPEYFSDKGNDFLRSFTAGFLTTCGLSYAGAACTDEEAKLGLHGRISHTPAEEFSYKVVNEYHPEIHVEARMREAVLFGENLCMNRKYIIKTDSNQIILEDTVENIGFRKVPHMMLYHINLGYPLLSEDAKLTLPSVKVTPRDARAATGLDTHADVSVPMDDYDEMCFFHQLAFDADGMSKMSLYNSKISKGLSITYDAKTLDRFVQWKMMQKGEYVMGLEPSNCHVYGRKTAREDGSLKYILPQEQIKYSLAFDILDGEAEAEQSVKDIKKLIFT